MTNQAVIALQCHSICSLTRGMLRPERYQVCNCFIGLIEMCPMLFLIY